MKSLATLILACGVSFAQGGVDLGPLQSKIDQLQSSVDQLTREARRKEQQERTDARREREAERIRRIRADNKLQAAISSGQISKAFAQYPLIANGQKWAANYMSLVRQVLEEGDYDLSADDFVVMARGVYAINTMEPRRTSANVSSYGQVLDKHRDFLATVFGKLVFWAYVDQLLRSKGLDDPLWQLPNWPERVAANFFHHIAPPIDLPPIDLRSR